VSKCEQISVDSWSYKDGVCGGVSTQSMGEGGCGYRIAHAYTTRENKLVDKDYFNV